MPRPVISVVVPSYNKVKYLRECLESIRRQSFDDWECIVVNDGSPAAKEIEKIVDSLKDPRFRCISHGVNRGLAAARNSGCREARGQFLICVDEDDKLRSDSLTVLRNALEKSGADIACSHGRTFGIYSKRFYRRLPTKEEVLHSSPLLGCGFLMRRKVWEGLGGWDESPIMKRGREDLEWWIRAIHANLHIAFVDDELYLIRVPASFEDEKKSLNLSAMRDEFQLRHYIVQKHKTLYDQYPRAKRIMLAKGYWHAGVWRIANKQVIGGMRLLLCSLREDPSLERVKALGAFVVWKLRSGLS